MFSEAVIERCLHLQIRGEFALVCQTEISAALNKGLAIGLEIRRVELEGPLFAWVPAARRPGAHIDSPGHLGHRSRLRVDGDDGGVRKHDGRAFKGVSL